MRSRLSIAGPLIAGAALVLLAACGRSGGPESAAGLPVSNLASTYYGSTPAAQVRTLVVVLHADQDSARLGTQTAFAQAAVEAIPRSAAVTILRPGYADTAGRQSPGDRGLGAGDNYTPEDIAEVAQSILAARARYPHARTMLVGDDGGAAIAANIAGLRPDLLDAMVLVSCPCTLPEWRSHMRKADRQAGWDMPVRSLDPLQTAGGVRSTLRAAIIVGNNARRVPPRFSRAYAEALALRGINTDFEVLPDKGDEILLDPAVLRTTAALAAGLPAEQRAERR